MQKKKRERKVKFTEVNQREDIYVSLVFMIVGFLISFLGNIYLFLGGGIFGLGTFGFLHYLHEYKSNTRIYEVKG